MSKSDNRSDKPSRGRPRNLGPTHCSHGSYARDPKEVLKFWRRYKPCNGRRVEEIIQKYLRQLKWDIGHPRYGEICDLAVLTVSRAELFMVLVEKEFTRDVFDKITGKFVKHRPCDQFRKLEELDDSIQERLRILGIIKK